MWVPACVLSQVSFGTWSRLLLGGVTSKSNIHGCREWTLQGRCCILSLHLPRSHRHTAHTTNLPTGFCMFSRDFLQRISSSLLSYGLLCFFRRLSCIIDICTKVFVQFSWLLPFRTPLASVVISPELREPCCHLLELICREHGWRPLSRFIVS